VSSALSITLGRFDEPRPRTPRSLTPMRPADFGRRALPPLIAEITGEVRSLRPLRAAWSNLVLLADGDRGRFVLKVAHDPYRAWQLGYEHDIMRGLAESDSGLPLAEPLVLAEEDGYAFLLQSCVAGRPLGQQRLGDAEKVLAAARLVRGIHAQPIGPFGYAEILERQLALAERNMRARLLDPGEFDECGRPDTVLSWLRRSRPSTGEVVLLHGDYRPKNILWDTGQASVVDWGLAIPGDAHYDLAVMLWHIQDPGPRSRFLDEYGQFHDPELLAYYDLLSKFLNV
jgi:aminoglycoside phosphotransferase